MAPSRTRLACLIVLAVAWAAASRAEVPCPRCTCVSPQYGTPEEAVVEALYAAEAVFMGEVIEIRTRSGIECDRVEGCSDPDRHRRGESPVESVLVGFRGESSWKGVGNDESTIAVATQFQESACGYFFDAGRRYLVYAYDYDKDGQLTTNLCARTRPAEVAGFDIGVLSRQVQSFQGAAE